MLSNRERRDENEFDRIRYSMFRETRNSRERQTLSSAVKIEAYLTEFRTEYAYSVLRRDLKTSVRYNW